MTALPARPSAPPHRDPPPLFTGGLRPQGTILLSELLGALSYALDLTEGQPPGHCMRACWIGVHLGRQIGLDEAALSDLYYAILLKDLGCSSNAARICELYLTDDRTFKSDYKRVGDSLPEALRFVLSHTGLKANLAERFRAVLHIVQNGGTIARELIETRCQRGAAIAQQMRFSTHVQAGILDLDEHWDGGGKPARLQGTDISLFARIALLAQVIDVFHLNGGPAAALAEIRHRSGTWFDPSLVEAAEAVFRDADFRAMLAGPSIEAAVLALAPARRAEPVDADDLDDIAIAFAQVIDAKSPYTHGHSDRVALFTDLIAGEMGVAGEERRWLKRAALLHDIGKLGVSNQVLDKPGKLDEAEWVEMRAHAAMSETILSRIAAFGGLAQVAGAHHERLDGKGYPRGRTARSIPMEARIIATADVFDALTADRPYRGPMSADKAFSIMDADAGSALDPACIAALKRALAPA
ncbi:MAG TPA: HD domain-containing phosphohydrolase [Beijerinckiaceae bacterium]|jgi:HD-GYP domain-containing protein (c-di-GMP phosphodiesterase class II)